MIRQRFQGYCCKSGIGPSLHGGSLKHYTYSPFKNSLSKMYAQKFDFIKRRNFCWLEKLLLTKTIGIFILIKILGIISLHFKIIFLKYIRRREKIKLSQKALNLNLDSTSFQTWLLMIQWFFLWHFYLSWKCFGA